MMQSDVGIIVSDDTNNFSRPVMPYWTVHRISKIPAFISLSKATTKVVKITFAISLVYSIIGLLFAVQGMLSPVITAILMPLSSVTIVLMATVSTTILARLKGL
jgi:Cu+-exporting ATPase